MFTPNLPLPHAEAIQSLRRESETMQLLAKLRADIVAAVGKLEPDTLMALARQYFPDADTNYHAVACFGLEVTDALRALTRHGEDVRSLYKAESARLAPLIGEAARRSLQIHGRLLPDADASIRSHDLRVEGRRAALMKGGMEGDDLERELAKNAPERDEMLSQRAALEREFESLKRFLTSRNEDHLPDGFTVPVPLVVRATAPDTAKAVSPLRFANAHG